MRGGYTVSQVGEILRITLRVDVEGVVAQVRMRVDESGDERLAADVKGARALRHRHATCRTDSRNSIAVNNHSAVLNDFIAIHRDDATAC